MSYYNHNILKINNILNCFKIYQNPTIYLIGSNYNHTNYKIT